jgi:spermidine/putrescine transport system substrate-binding protein
VSEHNGITERGNAVEQLLAGDYVSRRKFMAGLGAAGTAAFLAACGSSSSSSTSATSAGTSATANAAYKPAALAKGGELNIYTWPSYFAQKNLTEYKTLTGTTLNQTTYESNDAMFAKLAAENGQSGYDLAIPTSGWIPPMVDKGMLEEIDHSRVPFTNIDPKLLDQAFDRGNKYSVPKDYGYDVVIWDPSVITKNITTWSDFIDAIKGQGSGKSAYGIGYGTISIGLWALGYSSNDANEAHLKAAADLMKTTSAHVKSFSGFDVTGMVSGEIALMTCDQSVARQVLLQKPSFKYVTPGPHAQLWVDNYVLLKGAANTDQAYSFMDFALRPTSQVTDTNFIGYPTVLKGLEAKIPASTKFKNEIFIPTKVYGELETYVVNEKIIGLVEQLANEVQAA